MFGTERMIDALNKDPGAAPEQILKNVRRAVDEFVKNAEQFDDLGGAVITAESEFRDLPSWCSLVALSIMSMIDDEYGVRLRGDDIRASKTIRDIYNKVAEKQG